MLSPLAMSNLKVKKTSYAIFIIKERQLGVFCSNWLRGSNHGCFRNIKEATFREGNDALSCCLETNTQRNIDSNQRGKDGEPGTTINLLDKGLSLVVKTIYFVNIPEAYGRRRHVMRGRDRPSVNQACFHSNVSSVNIPN